MLYVVQLIDRQGFNNMMSGSLDFSVTERLVDAASKEEAIRSAKHECPDCVINEDFVLTFEAWKEFGAKRTKEAAETRRKDAEKKAKRALRELNKANEMGLTVADYRALKNRQATCRRYRKEIAKLQAQIAEMQSYIDRYERP